MPTIAVNNKQAGTQIIVHSSPAGISFVCNPKMKIQNMSLFHQKNFIFVY